jgi:AAA domain (dynein-related subfamily)
MSLIWFDKASELLGKAKNNPSLLVAPLYSGAFPMVNPADTTRADIELVNVQVFKVTVGSDEYVPVVLCRLDPVTDTPQWSIYCGDDQVSGKQRTDGKNLAAKLRAEGKVSTKLANVIEGSDWVGKVPAMAACGFMKMIKMGKFCSHTEAVLFSLQANDLEQMATDLKDWKSGAEVSATVTHVPMSEEEAIVYDAAFVQHVLLAGERGSGKTYLARQVAERYDAVYLEMQMHPSMEAWEFRAHDRSWNGKTFTVLGKLAEAVHWIKQGKKVVLCMDEFLNMNPLYATTINSPLTLTAKDTYLIETGRIIDEGDGIGTLETVEVPSDMLWVVATSNIGARYSLDKIAPSVRARFLIVLMNTNADRTRKILEKNLSEYGMPLALAEMFEKFLNACNQAVNENNMDEEATTRLACNVIRAVYKKAKRDKKSYPTLKLWVNAVKAQLIQEEAQVVNFELGPLDPDQSLRFKSLVNASFKA